MLIVGKIRTRDYEDNAGQKRYITEIIMEEMELLGAKKPEQAPAPEPEQDYKPQQEYKPNMARFDGQGRNDDLPF